ncbi:MAG: MFS transporter [Rhodobacteraceae bacterium]|nr:MFS transporter [Paracoccaceae bacterium]
MTTPATPVETDPTSGPAISGRLVLTMAAACGLIAANLYYAQPLAGEISRALGLSGAAAGVIVTMFQIGYGLGLLLIVPLGDILEKRGLIVTSLGLLAAVLLVAAGTSGATLFLVVALLIGMASVGIQVIVPFAADLAPEAERGRVVGQVMSGLMFGIMLARPLSSFIADISSWRWVFGLSAVAMIALAFTLRSALPRRKPERPLSYRATLASMGRLVLSEPLLRRRALYQACQFAAFSLFWTVTPLLLMGPVWGLSQSAVTLFALAGAAGVVSAPIAGRVADAGHGAAATALGMAIVAAGFLISHLAPAGTPTAFALLVTGAILVDFGVTMTLVIGQRVIYGLGADNRARLNAIFMATFFTGGAIGSAAGAWIYAHGGWTAASLAGAALPLAALAYFAVNRRRRSREP